jgi:hypothetical protein
MKRVARRGFLSHPSALTASTLATSMMGTSAQAQTAEFKLKFASNLPAIHPLNVRAKEAAEAILKDSGGRVDIQVFPNNNSVRTTTCCRRFAPDRSNSSPLSGLILSRLVPLASINGIGFAVKKYAQVWAAMDGDLGAHARDAIRILRATWPHSCRAFRAARPASWRSRWSPSWCWAACSKASRRSCCSARCCFRSRARGGHPRSALRDGRDLRDGAGPVCATVRRGLLRRVRDRPGRSGSRGGARVTLPRRTHGGTAHHRRGAVAVDRVLVVAPPRRADGCHVPRLSPGRS